MICFRWRGVAFSVEFSFFLVAALAGILGGTVFFFRLMFACLLHECGHLAVMALFHQPVRRVAVCGLGILICPGESLSAYGKDLIVLLSGPLVNLLVALGAWSIGAFEICSMHLSLGLFNLLPYPQLDGGAALYAWLCAMGFSPHVAGRIQTLAAFLCSLALVFLLLWNHVVQLSLYCMLCYLTLWMPLQGRFRCK